jgi:hypothetical protein
MIELNKLDRSKNREYRNVTIDLIDKNENYALWEVFAAPCCLYSKLRHLLFFHIQRLYLFASTLSAFR